MNERLSPPDDRFLEPPVTRSVAKPGHAVYSIDDDVVVAAVHGCRVEFLDAEGIAEAFDCISPEVAEHQALGYALLLLRPLVTPEEAP